MSKVSETEVRAEVRAWLAANWDPEMSLVEWRNQARRLRLGNAAVARSNGTAAACR